MDTVIYHRSDWDGVFCREIARMFLPNAELIGWERGDAIPTVPEEHTLYILDLSIPELMGHPNLIWIDHHASAMAAYPQEIKGYRIDGVAACRLAWQWFSRRERLLDNSRVGMSEETVGPLPTKQEFIVRAVKEPLAVRLAGEYDVWDKRDPRAELFQHGLRAKALNASDWEALLDRDSQMWVGHLLDLGRPVQFAAKQANQETIEAFGFTVRFEGLTFLACNTARYNSHLFAAGMRPQHDALMGFNWTGREWKVSLYATPNRPELDLSKIAAKYGGGGHKQACGFRVKELPFALG
jgi:hypothetical protein